MKREEYFVFRNIDSRDLNIKIASMPDIVKPKKRIQEITVPGRDGNLLIDEGTYESYSMSIECGIRNLEDVDGIFNWLSGSGELIISTEPDKIYKATVSNAIPIADIVYLYSSFVVTFKVQPFKSSVNWINNMLEIQNSPATIMGKGSVVSEPIITVYGTGNVTLSINGTDYIIEGINQYVTINSEIQEVYRDGENKNNTMKSDGFPLLKPDENLLTYTGNVSKIEINPNWRWF